MASDIDRDRMVRIRVHAKDGGEHEVKAPPDFSLLKGAVSDATGVAPDQQRLVHCGVVISEDSASLAEVLACEESLYLIPRIAEARRQVCTAAG